MKEYWSASRSIKAVFFKAANLACVNAQNQSEDKDYFTLRRVESMRCVAAVD
jgi:hypothetical protein